MTANRYLLNKVWSAMKARCTNPAAQGFHKYGARGITVCQEWSESFEAFRDWAYSNGYREGLSLDREKNEQGYSPANCRWTDKTTQSRNRRPAQGASSPFMGVYRCTARQKWVAQVTVNKKKKTLGLFDDDRAAAVARDSYIVSQGLQNFTLNNVLP